MSCTYPLALSLPQGIVKVPCGRCIGCRMDISRDWALRCMCEAQMHSENCFLTLTYNDINLPYDGSVKKSELSNFIKRLRKFLDPLRIRYYGCGEYGDLLRRPHYHLLVFGYDPPDKEFIHVSQANNKKTKTNRVYRSASLETVWNKGFVTVGSVCMESAGYVCRYVRKKIGGEMAVRHYNGLTPEFALMSRRPGIGTSWYEKYWRDLFPKDFVTFDGRKYKAPRFFDNKLQKQDPELYLRIKELRKENIREDDIVRRLQKEKYLKNVTKTLKRRLEV